MWTSNNMEMIDVVLSDNFLAACSFRRNAFSPLFSFVLSPCKFMELRTDRHETHASIVFAVIMYK